MERGPKESVFQEFLEKFKKAVKSPFQIGHEDVNDLMFAGQRAKWVIDENTKKKFHVTFEQPLCAGKRDTDLHTAYRSLLGSINWLQSRTQFQSCYQFPRCASAAAAPTIGDCKALNKLFRQLVGDPMAPIFWPFQGDPEWLLSLMQQSETTATHPHNVLRFFAWPNLAERRVKKPKVP